MKCAKQGHLPQHHHRLVYVRLRNCQVCDVYKMVHEFGRLRLSTVRSATALSLLPELNYRLVVTAMGKHT